VTLRADVAALAAMTRDSAGEGERAAAAWLAGRLRGTGVNDVSVEPFRSQSSYAPAHALHALAGMAGGAISLAALVSLELEASGRSQWIRRILPSTEGANVVARIPSAGMASATLVLVAHHDAAKTGMVWRVARPWRPAARSMGAFMAPTAVALALAAVPRKWPRRLGRALLALSVLADADIARSATVPGASDNATGVAALIALAERWLAQPLEGVEVWLVSCGCEESGMGGMAAFLRAHRAELEHAGTFVLGIDTLGAGTPIVARSEGPILAHGYDGDDLALVDAGARRARTDEPARWRLGGWTDPILARFAGLRSACLLSIGPDGLFTNYHLPSDVPEAVDFGCVERCIAIAAGVGEELDANLT
jgi:hypothetical protein